MARPNPLEEEDPLAGLFPPPDVQGGPAGVAPGPPGGFPGGGELPPDLLGPEAGIGGGTEFPDPMMDPALAGGMPPPPPGAGLPPDLMDLEDPNMNESFTAPLPPVPLSMPPNVGGATSPGGGRSFLPPPQKPKLTGASPGTPYAGEGEGEDPERMRMIFQQLGL